MRTTKLYLTVQKILTMLLLMLLGGKYVGSGTVSEVRFLGFNKIVLKMGSCSNVPMTGKYTIKDGKLIASMLDQKKQHKELTFTFKREYNAVILDNEILARINHPFLTVPQFLTVMLVTLIVCVGLTVNAARLRGIYKGPDDWNISEVQFSGSNRIVLIMASYFDKPLHGTYTIKDGKLIANVAYMLGDERQDEEFTFTYQREGNTITLDNEKLTKK